MSYAIPYRIRGHRGRRWWQKWPSIVIRCCVSLIRDCFLLTPKQPENNKNNKNRTIHIALEKAVLDAHNQSH